MRFRTSGSDALGFSGVTSNGGTVTMPIKVLETPTGPMDAVSKSYVDSAASAFAGSSFYGVFDPARLPAFTGADISSIGGGIFTLKSNLIAEGRYGRVTVDSKGRVTSGSGLVLSDIPTLNWSKVINKPNTVTGYGITDIVSLNANSMTGALELDYVPTDPNVLVNKDYVDEVVAASSGSAFATGDIISKYTSETPIRFLKANGGIVSKSVYANLYSVIGDRFTPNIVLGSNAPWVNQYDFNLASQGSLSSWTASGNLVTAKSNAEVIVTKNKVYMIGGFTTSTVSNVQVSTIDINGTLGAWANGTSLPFNITKFQLAVTKNKVYLIGGDSGTTTVASVYVATINSNGDIGTFVFVNNLPAPTKSACSFVTRSKIYVVGGINGSTPSNKVYVADVDSEGNISSWSTGTDLPKTIYNSKIISTKNKVYITGGDNGVSSSGEIFSATVLASGSIGAWSVDLNSGKDGQESVIILAGVTYKFKGQTKESTNTVESVTVSLNAGVSNTIIANLPPGGYITYSYQGSNTTQFNVTSSGSINIPANVTAINITSKGGNGYPYYPGQSYEPAVPYDPGQPYISGSDYYPGQGNPAFPNGLPSYSSVTTYQYIWSNGSEPVTVVQENFAGGNSVIDSINDFRPAPTSAGMSGTVIVQRYNPYSSSGYGTITTTTYNYVSVVVFNSGVTTTVGNSSYPNGLPSYVPAQAAVAGQPYIAPSGGYAGQSYIPSSPATAGSDTTVTYNSVTRVFPGGDGSNAVASSVDFTPLGVSSTMNYTVGSPSGYVNITLTAPPSVITQIANSSGSYSLPSGTSSVTIEGKGGSWSTGLAASVQGHSVFVTDTKAYLLGGNGTNKVYAANIAEDGVIGTWVSETDLPYAISNFNIIATSSNLYIIGGLNSSNVSQNTVRSVAFKGGKNDYMEYLSPIYGVSPDTHFYLPDASIGDANGSYSYIKY